MKNKKLFDIKVSECKNSEHLNDGTFLQTPFWCSFKARHGWTYKRFFIELSMQLEDNSLCQKDKNNSIFTKSFELAVLNRGIAKNLFSIAYIPLMPELPFKCTDEKIIEQAFNEEEQVSVVNSELITPETQTIEFAWLLQDLAKAIKPYLPKNTIAIRYDPNVMFSSIEERDDFIHGMKLVCFADRIKIKKSKVDIQPPDSTLVDLTADENEILNRMHQKWRYNIRLSERKGVIIRKYDGKSVNLSEKIDKFYELTKETNARDGNSSHAKAYYKDLIEYSAQENSDSNNQVPQVNLYIAEHEGDEIASIMTLFSKTESIYLFGASSNKKRNLMPNHLLQWTAMKDAKQYGSLYYDMYGMSPEGKNENHPMHGLYMFKANFGGKNIHRIGSWDFPLKFSYKLYRIAENLRAWWFKVVRKKIRGR